MGNRYSLDRELGQGGMATVYLAEDVKHHRWVAVKVLKPELAATLGAERFLREIELSARLTHPHIVPLHDSGSAGGYLYYVMPYVEGETLRDRLSREKQLPLEDALLIAREVADALAYAHGQGVIHRDIKPENVLLESGHAVVSDFGIAKAVRVAGGERLTETGMAVGTPAYMSPEQAAGETDLDARSDVYSLGCVLYEMLGGETPYTGPTPQAILAKKLTEPVPRVSVVRETVPPGIEAVLVTALAKAPADRYPTARRFAEALAHPPAARSRRGAPRRWARPALAAALVLVVAVAAWLGWRALGSGGRSPIRSLAVLPPQDLSGDTALAPFVLGVFDGLVGELQQVGALRVISRTSAAAYAGTTKPVPQIARELGVDGIVGASVLRQGDSVHLRVELVRAAPAERTVWGRRYDRDVRGVFELYGDVAKDIAAQVGAVLTGEQEARLSRRRTVDPRTYEAYVEAMYYLDKGSAAMAARGIALLREAVDRDPGNALGWAGLSVGYITAAHGPDPPFDALPSARAAAGRALMLDSTLAETMAALAFLKGYYDWRWDEAERLFLRAIELNPSCAMAHYWYAWQLALFDHLDSAIAEHRRAREADPLNPLHTAWLAQLYVNKGDASLAMEEIRRALALDSTYAIAYVVLAHLYAAQDSTERALEAARRAYALDPDWKFQLGVALARAGRRSEALRIRSEMEAARRTPWNAYGLAALSFELGDSDAAFRWLDYERPHAWVPWLVAGQRTSPLRTDPRLLRWLERVHVPPRGA